MGMNYINNNLAPSQGIHLQTSVESNRWLSLHFLLLLTTISGRIVSALLFLWLNKMICAIVFTCNKKPVSSLSKPPYQVQSFFYVESLHSPSSQFSLLFLSFLYQSIIVTVFQFGVATHMIQSIVIHQFLEYPEPSPIIDKSKCVGSISKISSVV